MNTPDPPEGCFGNRCCKFVTVSPPSVNSWLSLAACRGTLRPRFQDGTNISASYYKDSRARIEALRLARCQTRQQRFWLMILRRRFVGFLWAFLGRSLSQVARAKFAMRLLVSSPARHWRGKGIHYSRWLVAWIPFPTLQAAGNDTRCPFSGISGGSLCDALRIRIARMSRVPIVTAGLRRTTLPHDTKPAPNGAFRRNSQVTS